MDLHLSDTLLIDCFDRRRPITLAYHGLKSSSTPRTTSITGRSSSHRRLSTSQLHQFHFASIMQFDPSVDLHACITSRQNIYIYIFIHSGYFYSASSRPLLLRGASDTARILCRSFTLKCYRQLRLMSLRGGYSGIRTRDPSDKRRRIYQWATTPHNIYYNIYILYIIYVYYTYAIYTIYTVPHNKTHTKTFQKSSIKLSQL